MAVDTSPASEADQATPITELTATNAGDCYGSITATAATPLLRVAPPKFGLRTSVDWLQYDNLAAAVQTLTMMVRQDWTKVAAVAAAGQAVINVEDALYGVDGGIIAADDYIITQNKDGVFVAYKVTSVANLTAITITASIGDATGSGVGVEILPGAGVFFMGAPADHAKRQYTVKASTLQDFAPPGGGLCVTPGDNEPILIHSGNGTTAGYMTGPRYTHPKI